MSGQASDSRLEALLRDLPPPPVPADLAARVLAVATAEAQEPHQARARRQAARRDRRGRWLRRPLLAGTVALGLVVSSAVAATLAGVPIPQKIAAVFFPEQKAPAPKQAETPRRAVRSAPAPVRVAPVAVAEAKPEGDLALSEPPGPLRRLARMQHMVDARRAMGLPTPHADRLERRLHRRAELWRQATPEQRARWLDRQRGRREALPADLASLEAQAEFAGRREQLRQWRMQRQAGIPLTSEQRAERRALARQWREARRARWRAGDERPEPADR